MPTGLLGGLRYFSEGICRTIKEEERSKMSKERPVKFDLLRINKGMKKICTCNPPHYEISVENRIIMCRDCGVVIDPFEAMLSIAEYHEQLREEMNRLKEKAKVYSEEANKELKRMRKSRVFREMEEAYRKDMIPRCPECGKYFDPLKITSWTRR